MADGVTDRKDSADATGTGASKPRAKPRPKPKPKRALTKAERARRRKAAAEARAAAAEAERRAALSPSELIAEDEAAAERERARNTTEATVLRGELYKSVMRQWTEGWSVQDLADHHGLSVRRVEQIVSDLRESHLTQLGVGDPLFSVKFAQRLVIQRAAAVSQYARLAEEISDEKMLHVKLGYLKQRDEALDRFTQLVQELGWLPRNLGTLNTVMDAMQMAEVMLEVMERQGVPVETQRTIVEAIELRVVRKGSGLALAGVGPVMDGSAEDIASEGEVHDGVGPGTVGDGPDGGRGDHGAGAAAPGAPDGGQEGGGVGQERAAAAA